MPAGVALSRTGRRLGLVVAGAVLLRLAVWMMAGGYSLSTDENHWRRMGMSIYAEGWMAPRAHTYRPPLYPLFIAATYHLAGLHDGAVRIAQALLGAATCLLVYALGVRIGTPATGMLAAVAAAGYPLLVLFANLLMAEVLLTVLVLLCVLAALRLLERDRLVDAALLGAACGLAALCKPVVLAWVPLLVAVWGWVRLHDGVPARAGGQAWDPARDRKRDEAWARGSTWARDDARARKRDEAWARQDARKENDAREWEARPAPAAPGLAAALARGAALAAGLLLVLAPWSLRNAAMTGHWTPLSTNLGINLLIGHEPEATGGYRHGVDYLSMYHELVDYEMHPVVANRLATRRMLRVMVASPLRTVQLAIRKIVELWSPRVTGTRGWLAVAGALSTGPVIVLGLGGLWQVRRTHTGLVVGSLALALTLVHALIFANTRFRLPVDAALLAPAALMAQRLWRRWRDSRSRRR